MAQELSNDNLATLQHLCNLLHLFNHRNKNQHRRSIWWRPFSTFRNHLSELIKEQQRLQKVSATHLQRTRKVVKDEATKTRLTQRVTLWQDVLVPKWHHSFSQIIADGRFAVLGLVLLAVLAQTCHIVGVTSQFEELGQDEVEKAIEEFGQEYWAEQDHSAAGRTDHEDLGEVIARDEEVAEAVRISETTTTLPDQPRAGTDHDGSTKKRKPKVSNAAQSTRKKSKRHNAIDDLFSGLG